MIVDIKFFNKILPSQMQQHVKKNIHRQQVICFWNAKIIVQPTEIYGCNIPHFRMDKYYILYIYIYVFVH